MPVLNPCVSQNAENQAPQPTLSRKHPVRVLELVGEAFGTSAIVIVSHDRHRMIAQARFGVMWVLRELGHSYPEIGRIIQRDHTTAIQGVKRANSMREKDSEFLRLTDNVLQEVRK